MNRKPFAFWNTPTQRTHRTAAPVPGAPLSFSREASRRFNADGSPKFAPLPAASLKPFSKPCSDPQPGSDSALKTARIYLFTGSNTPYQSHE